MSKTYNKLLFVLVLISPIIYGQKLNPGDGIRISFLNIEDLVNGDYYVQENGNLHLPYAGTINTTDLNIKQLQSRITVEYSKLYRNPKIDIQPMFRVVILGEIKKPGVYYLTGLETLTDLVSIAGGETSDSNIEDVVIIRDSSKLTVNLKSFWAGQNNQSDISIRSGDKVYIPRSWWAGARDASIIFSGVAVVAAIAGLIAN